MNLQDLYQELIIDHGTQPRNCCALQNANGTAEGYNPLCGDQIKVYLHIENEIITKAAFTGTGCAISMASASLMTETLLNKTISEALALSSLFKAQMTTDCCEQHCLGKLNALCGVKAYPARVKCATLAWHTLQAAIKQESTGRVSTESVNPIESMETIK